MANPDLLPGVDRTPLRARTRRSGPGGYPPGPDLLGSARLLGSFFDDPTSFYLRQQAAWGDVVGVRAGSVRMVTLFDLDLVKEVLVDRAATFHKGSGLRATRYVLGEGMLTSDGEHHDRARRLAQPVFQPRNLEPLAADMVRIAGEHLDAWPAEGGEVDAATSLYGVSLEIAAEAMFGAELDAPARARLRDAMAAVNDGYRLLAAPGGQRLARLLAAVPPVRRLARARAYIGDVVRGFIDDRRAEAGAERVRRDLLTLLMAARDEDGSGFDDAALRDEATTMLLAGHDTTAATFSWVLAMLVAHPEELARVRAEVDEVLDGGRDPVPGDLRALARLRAVVEETMRLQPVAYSTVRTPVDEPWTVRGWTVQPGEDIAIPIGAIHRDPRHWDEPDEFRPERFLDREAARAHHRCAFIPFGTGPRVCIGSHFALQQTILVLAVVLRDWELEPPPGHAPVRAHVGLIRRPAGGLRLHVRRRAGR